MDPIASTRAALATTVTVESPPQRRWSDGPNYPWSPATDDAWSVATHWPALVAVLCEQVAAGSGDIAREMDRLRAQGKLGRGDAAAVRRALQAMRGNSLALQQIVRLGAGLFNFSPDLIELTAVARGAVHERQIELLRRGVDISFDLHRAEVWVDGAVAAGLMQAGIEWALSFSNKVRLKIEPGDGGTPARVVIRGALAASSAAAARTPAGVARRSRRMNDNLHWILLRQLASCARLGISRSSSAATEAAVIEFPATISIAPGGFG
jgi:hypothetical protein